MTASWEIRQNPPTLVCILHTELTSIAWALGLRSLIIPGPFQMPLCVAGMPFDHARNSCCQRALELGAEWLFFLDSDIIPPRDVIPRLIAHQKPFISGIYYRRSPPHGVPVAIKDGSWMTNLPHKGLVEADVVGAGCLLMHRDLLQRCPPQRPDAGKHWFDWRVDMGHILLKGENLSEDFTLCVHLKRTLGVPTLLDCSIRCKHCGLSQATENKMEPLDLAGVA